MKRLGIEMAISKDRQMSKSTCNFGKGEPPIPQGDKASHPDSGNGEKTRITCTGDYPLGLPTIPRQGRESPHLV